MKTVVLGDPPEELVSLIEKRRRLGIDRRDEIWNGDYHMAPAPSFRHATVVGALIALFHSISRPRGLTVTAEFNLGEEKNFRIPDLGVHRSAEGVLFNPTAAVVVEVRSPYDESYEKLGHYFDHGVEEILIVDPALSTCQWYVRGTTAFELADTSAVLGLAEADLRIALGW